LFDTKNNDAITQLGQQIDISNTTGTCVSIEKITGITVGTLVGRDKNGEIAAVGSLQRTFLQ